MLCALCILSMPFSLICIIDLGIPSPAVYLFAPTWIVNGWTFLPFIPFFPILFFSFALALPFPLFIYYFNFPNLAEQLSCIYHIVTIDIRILYLIHRLYCYNYVYNSYTFYPVNPISAPYRLQLIGVLSFIIQFSVRIHTYCILSQFDTLAHFVIFTHSDRDRKCKQRKKKCSFKCDQQIWCEYLFVFVGLSFAPTLKTLSYYRLHAHGTYDLNSNASYMLCRYL